MMFSTKAEYGVRVMVELARRAGETARDPVSAGGDRRARRAAARLSGAPRRAAAQGGPGRSRRGSRGGYMLARPADEITMAEVVEALEGSIAPIECISEAADGSIVCSRESDPEPRLPDEAAVDARALLRSCARCARRRSPTSSSAAPPRRARRCRPEPRSRSTDTQHPTPHDWSLNTNMADLEIRDLHVRTEEREILRGVDLDISRGEIHALMGPNGSGKSTLANTLLGHPAYEITEGSITFKGEDITEAEPHERAQGRAVPGLPVPGLDPRRVGRELPAHGDQRQARGADPGQGVPHPAPARDRAARRRPLVHLAPSQRRLLRRREEARGDPADGDARTRTSRSSTRPTRASTSTRCAPSPRACSGCTTSRAWAR